ncbi:zinc finger protein 774 [Orussus abietinus]|uniref:zinc finger protein 774 n=1 Tax=Orussus abietinus TaxID=222816 RepID=UPI0006250796|nr:zinc finger protein 774 [Orussus abietinus]
MSGYRRVNYYELCRLCTSSEGNKMNIFREEGRRRQLQNKIQTYLPIQVLEEDSLPKIVCHECVKKLESYIEFRETVVSAEGMLESYFTSLRFSEDFLKEGKVYVKSTEKERAPTPSEEDPLKCEDKVIGPPNNQTATTEHQPQHQQPVVVSNVNASNIQIISGVQARVQQYKCAMQMPSGAVAAAVVEATAETHYSYQQQTSQQVSPQQQSNPTQNQIPQQQSQSQPPQIQHVQNQIQNQNQNQMSQQIQTRQIPQQQSQPPQIVQNPNQVNQQPQQQQQQQQNQSQVTQQIQQMQRQQREFEKQRQLQQMEKQQVHIVQQQQDQQQTQMLQHQNNNVIMKNEDTVEQSQPVIQKAEKDSADNDGTDRNVQTYTTVQASPEVFLSLGFKEGALSAHATREDIKDFKEYVKNSPDDGMSRNSIGQISEFLRIRSAPEQPSLITVNPQVISQNNRSTMCCDCGKTFPSLNQMNGHTCTTHSLINEVTEGIKEESPPSNSISFSCDVCGKPFKRKEHLFQHRKLHTGERPYVCTTCTKAFSRKEHLVRHSVSHTGQKMHECEMCGKSFSRKDNLHKHRKTHGVSGPYICETCGKSFVVKHYYLMHLTTHAPTVTDGVNCQDPLPYKCDICHKAFSVKQYLTTHKLRHRSKNSANHGQSSANVQQQQQQQQPQPQQQTGATNGVTVPGNGVNDSSHINGTAAQPSNASVVEIQNVVERSEQPNGSFGSNHYHGNVQQFQ